MGKTPETLTASASLEGLNASFIERNHGYAEDVRETLRQAVRVCTKDRPMLSRVPVRHGHLVAEMPGLIIRDPNPDQKFMKLATGDIPITTHFIDGNGEFREAQTEYNWKYGTLIVLPETIRLADDETVIKLGKIAIDLLREASKRTGTLSIK
jgi:hypothetical protein